MQFLRTHPFFRLLVLQLTGIYLAVFLPEMKRWLLLLLLIHVGAVIIRIRSKVSASILHSSLLCMLVITISFLSTCYSRERKPDLPPGTFFFEAMMLDYPIEKARSLQATAQIMQTASPGPWNQKLLLYLEKSEKAKGLRPGDRITAQAAPREIQNKGNPFEFDYRSYMSHKHIRLSTYLPSGQYRITPVENPPLLMKIDRIQHWLALKLKEKTGNNASFQIISAMSLGYRDELTKETQTSFVATGAMHVLSVSGLHVAMIFLFLDLFLSRLKGRFAGHLFYFLVMMISLWCYAFLTGFSPPVQRSAIMFSFILAGNSLNRPASIGNTVAASAFFILLFNPDLIFDVGFQLSYAAVAGIVFFYPLFNSLVQSERWFIRYPWQLLCVSFAAQIGTFPLTIFYFNQFPVYFWLSNFIVVPAAYLILLLTGAFFVLSFSDLLSLWVARLLNTVTDLTLYLLSEIAGLPGAVITDLSVSMGQFLLLMTMLVLTALFIVSKKHIWLFGIFSLGLLFEAAGLYQKVLLFGQQKIIVYRSEQKTIHLINGRKNYIVTEKAPDEFLYRDVLIRLKLNEPVVVRTTDSISSADLIVRKQAVYFAGKSLLLDTTNLPASQSLIKIGKGVTNLKELNHTLLLLQTD